MEYDSPWTLLCWDSFGVKKKEGRIELKNTGMLPYYIVAKKNVLRYWDVMWDEPP